MAGRDEEFKRLVEAGLATPPVPQQQQTAPTEFPLPELVIRTFSWRLATVADRSTYTLRVTPCTPVAPGVVAPSVDHHTDIVLDASSMLGMFAQFAELATDEQKAQARAALSDIELPPAPIIEMP